MVYETLILWCHHIKLPSLPPSSLKSVFKHFLVGSAYVLPRLNSVFFRGGAAHPFKFPSDSPVPNSLIYLSSLRVKLRTFHIASGCKKTDTNKFLRESEFLKTFEIFLNSFTKVLSFTW